MKTTNILLSLLFGLLLLVVLLQLVVLLLLPLIKLDTFVNFGSHGFVNFGLHALVISGFKSRFYSSNTQSSDLQPNIKQNNNSKASLVP